jgi:hypothetical protein
MPSDKTKETTVPFSLLVVGIVLLFIASIRSGGWAGFGAILIGMIIETVIRVFLLVIAAFVTAKLISAGFGNLSSAILKFAAMVVFTSGLSLAINVTFVGWAIAVICWFCLLIYLFALDGKEALIFMGVMFVVNILITFFIVGLIHVA